jgi:ribosomal protein S27AE
MGEIEGKDETERERYWCGECGLANFPHESSAPDDPLCPDCGSGMKPLGNLSRTERSSFAFQEWMDGLHTGGLWGPSPGGAAARLGCDRSMIDKLAERGILEKSVYDRDGYFVVMISERSVEKAKENKAKRGKWTDSGED